MNNYVYSRKNQDNFLKSSWFFLYKMNFVIFSSSLYIYTYYLLIYIFTFSSPSSCFSIKFK
ncbi:hypothetical protein COF47_27000 [Bacillus wiedmannii]|nr:hypothetical protein COF47_27000 [Bacillus wiedmannii]